MGIKSQDLAEIESGFRALRNKAIEIADVDEKIRRLNFLEQEELRSINLESVWTTIAKLWAARKIERSYLFNGDLGPDNPIKQYMVDEADLTFFDTEGLVVVTRVNFDSFENEPDTAGESGADVQAYWLTSIIGSGRSVVYDVDYDVELRVFQMSKENSALSLEYRSASVEELQDKFRNNGWERADTIYRQEGAEADLWYKNGQFVAGWIE